MRLRLNKLKLFKLCVAFIVITLLLHTLFQESSKTEEKGGNAKVKETTEEIINIGQLMRQHEEDLNKEVENDKEAVDDKDKEEDIHDTVDSLAGGRNHGVPDEEPSSSKGAPGVDKIDEIKWNIEKENRQQTIYNHDQFGNITNSTVVIAIQVHDRITYLRYLIESLSTSSNIESTLLIFSHDVWSADINDLVRSINFTKVLQIYFPYSLQTNPSSFPGKSSGDCPKDWRKKDYPQIKNCTNSKWPDVHGHYREARYSQTKHHWWWKANEIFHHVDALKHFTGHVVFVEEDHYVAPDFLLLLDMMKYHQEHKNPQVEILSLGTYLRKFSMKGSAREPAKAGSQVSELLHVDGVQPQIHRSLKSLLHPQPHQHHQSRRLLWEPSFFNSLLNMFHQEVKIGFDGYTRYSKYQKAEVTDWVSSKHNMGMAFTRKVWNKIHGCSRMFCTYDDYNWDWSLQKISLSCVKPNNFKVLVLKGPRIFHVGECGVHQKNKDCDHNVVVRRVKTILKTVNSYLFPSNLVVQNHYFPKKIRLKKGNGGWGDRRDHQLCMNMTYGN